MALLKFRVFIEENDATFRDVVVRHSQTFKDLHDIILKAYNFDAKHQATFYRSNENWRKGREITLEIYDKVYKVEPLLMQDTRIANEIFSTDQKFIYEYDFVKGWTFFLSLISVVKEEDKEKQYPLISRTEGPAPLQYAKNTVLGEQFMDIEEKYDLHKDSEGFSAEGEDKDTDMDEDSFGEEIL